MTRVQVLNADDFNDRINWGLGLDTNPLPCFDLI